MSKFRKYIKKQELLDSFFANNHLVCDNEDMVVECYRIAGNTLYVKDRKGTEYIHYYDTTVCIKNSRTGYLKLCTNAWHTPTTKDRMNLLSPLTVSMRANQLYVGLNTRNAITYSIGNSIVFSNYAKYKLKVRSL